MPRKTREQKALELAKLKEQKVLDQNQEEERLAFSSRIFSVASLPVRRYSHPTYYRKIGKYDFYVQAGMDPGQRVTDPEHPPMLEVPWGVNARRILIWIDSEVIRTKDNIIGLGRSFSEFMMKIGIPAENLGGHNQKPLIRQLKNILGSRFLFQKRNVLSQKSIQMHLADEWEVWFDSSGDPDQLTLDQGTIVISKAYAIELAKHGVPLDLRVVQALADSPIGLDFYRWLSYQAYRCYQTGEELRLPMDQFLKQWGTDYSEAWALRRDLKGHLQAIQTVWDTLRCSLDDKKVFLLQPCPPSIPVKQMPKELMGRKWPF